MQIAVICKTRPEKRENFSKNGIKISFSSCFAAYMSPCISVDILVKPLKEFCLVTMLIFCEWKLNGALDVI